MIKIELDRVAHGGYVVGRYENKVIFVTGGLPGETVTVEITERGKRFDRGRVVEVVRAAPGRIEPPCPIANDCGGCDWQHADHATQLELKTAVVAEQLRRLGGYEWDGSVEPVEPTAHWRTRMRYAVDQGLGMRAKRSHDVVPLPEQGCMIAAPGPSVAELNELGRGASELTVAVSDDEVAVATDKGRVSGPPTLQHAVAGRRYMVGFDGFWQVHPAAPSVLVDAVMQGVEPAPGEQALDLYCGVGLFAGALVDAGCRVLGVDYSKQAIASARHNVPQAQFLSGPLEKLLPRLPKRNDVIVLDPPRKGAGRHVIRNLVQTRPRVIAYVACDPAALGRDVSVFREFGWEVSSVRGFDLFPMTHHVECVAILNPMTRNGHEG